jgi:hypothetical protein
VPIMGSGLDGGCGPGGVFAGVLPARRVSVGPHLLASEGRTFAVQTLAPLPTRHTRPTVCLSDCPTGQRAPFPSMRPSTGKV